MDQQEKIPQGPPSDQSDDEADQFVKGGKNRHVINADGEIEAQEKKENRGDDDEMLFAIEQAEGDEFMAVKPWKGAMHAPSDHPEIDNSAPEQEYYLQYVYGYRCSDSRQNVRYTSEGKVVYFTAAIGVVLDQATNTQQIFGGKAVKAGMHSGTKYHNDDITCLNISRDRTLIASGQVGSKPSIIVWNCVSLEPVQRIVLPKGSRAVKTIAINNDSTLVACSDDHNDHNVRVYEIATGKMLFEHQSGSSKLYDMDFSPTEDSFVIAGHKTIKFYKGNGDGTYSDNKGILGPAMKELTAFSSANYNSSGQAVITNIKGSVLTFKDRSCCDFKQGVHKGAIFAAYMDQSDVLYTGGKDGFVRSSEGTQWEFGHTIRSVDVSNKKLVVGLRNGTIAEQELENNDSKAVLMQSHFEGEVWGLDKFGDGKTLITSGDDNCIMLWDYEQRKRIGCGTVSEKAGKARKAAKGASTMSDLPPNQQSRAVCHSDVSGHIAVSDNEGNVTIRAGVNSLDEIVTTLNPKAKQWIEAMEYSPDGSKLAVGSHDNFIRLYSVESGYEHHCTLKGHNSFITSLDWSADGKYIRSNCGAYELLFFDTETGDHLPDGASMTADVKWASHTCKIAWDTEEIFPPGTDGTHVNRVAQSESGKIFASGDDWGLVCLHRNPIRNPKHKCNSYRAHSEHVVNVIFDKNDEYIFSVGGYDQTLMQWRKVQ